MARSIPEIYNAIVTEKEDHSTLKELAPKDDKYAYLLNDLTTKSNVALWRLWAYITATAINIHEQLWDVFKGEIKAMTYGAIYGTPAWYEKQALQFQLGDPLLIKDDKATYEKIDPDKKIIKKVAVTEIEIEGNDGEYQGNFLTLKVAKEDAGVLAPLDDGSELTFFKEYIRLLKPAGIKIHIISLLPDRLRIACTVYYNPLYEIGDVKKAVREAVENYLLHLDFDGIVYIQKITDAIQQVDGVENVSLLQCQANVGTDVREFTAAGTYETAAGYIVLKDEEGDTFEDTVIFEAGV